MSGPEHYRQAELLLQQVAAASPEWLTEWGRDRIAEAQVHATLALVAAQADAQYGAVDEDCATQWRDAVRRF